MKRASYRRRLSRSIHRDTQPRLVVTGTNNLFARSKRISKNSCQAARRARVSSTFRAYQIAKAAINLYPACREMRTKQKAARRERGEGDIYIYMKRQFRARKNEESLTIYTTQSASRVIKRSIIRSHNMYPSLC